MEKQTIEEEANRTAVLIYKTLGHSYKENQTNIINAIKCRIVDCFNRLKKEPLKGIEEEAKKIYKKHITSSKQLTARQESDVISAISEALSKQEPLKAEELYIKFQNSKGIKQD
jgi:hypothetical protein